MPDVWMINPDTETNPHRRGKKRHAKQARSKRRRARARHNPGPHRKRRSSSRRRHHNPSMAVAGLDFQKIALGVGGAIGADIGGDWVAGMLPANFHTGPARLAVKGALVVVGSMLLGRVVGRQAAVAMGTGGLILIGVDAARQYLLPYIAPKAAATTLAEGASGLGRFIDSEAMSGLGLMEEQGAGRYDDAAGLGEMPQNQNWLPAWVAEG